MQEGAKEDGRVRQLVQKEIEAINLWIAIDLLLDGTRYENATELRTVSSQSSARRRRVVHYLAHVESSSKMAEHGELDFVFSEKENATTDSPVAKTQHGS